MGGILSQDNKDESLFKAFTRFENLLESLGGGD